MDRRSIVERYLSRAGLESRLAAVKGYLLKNYSDEILRARFARIRRRVEEALSRHPFFSRYVEAPEPEPVEKISIAAERFRMADGEYRLEAHLPDDGPERIGSRHTGDDLLDAFIVRSVGGEGGGPLKKSDPVIARIRKRNPAGRGATLANAIWLRAVIDHTIRYNPMERWEEMLGLDEERADRMRDDLAALVVLVGDGEFTLEDTDSLMLLMGMAAERDGVGAELAPYLEVLGRGLDWILDNPPGEHGMEALNWLASRMEKGSRPGPWHVDNLRKLLAALGQPENKNLLLGMVAQARADAKAFIDDLSSSPVPGLNDLVRQILTPPGLNGSQVGKAVTALLQGTARQRGQVMDEMIKLRQAIDEYRSQRQTSEGRRPGVIDPAYHMNLAPLGEHLETLYGRLLGKPVELTDDQAARLLRSGLPYYHPEPGDMRLFKILDKTLTGAAHPKARAAAAELSQQLAATLSGLSAEDRPLLESFIDHLNQTIDFEPELDPELPPAPVKAAHEVVIEYRHLEEFTQVGREAVNGLLTFTRTNLISAAVEYHQYPPTVMGGAGEDPATTELPLDYGGNTKIIANAVRGAHALVNLAAAGIFADPEARIDVGPLVKVCANHPVREIKRHVGAWMDRISHYEDLPADLQSCWTELELRAETVQEQDKPTAAWLKHVAKRTAKLDQAALADHLVVLITTLWPERNHFVGSRIHRRHELLMDRLKGLIWMASLWPADRSAPALVDFAADTCFAQTGEGSVSFGDLGNAILWALANLKDGAGAPHLETLAGRVSDPALVKRIKTLAAKTK